MAQEHDRGINGRAATLAVVASAGGASAAPVEVTVKIENLAPGLRPVGDGGVLDSEMFANADFTAAGYDVARIAVTLDGDGSPSVVPLPSAVLAAVPAIGLAAFARRRWGEHDHATA